MQKSVFFLTLNVEQDIFLMACSVIARCYLRSKVIVVLCTELEQAKKLDELLWQYPKNRFLPHELIDDKTRQAQENIQILNDIALVQIYDCLICLDYNAEYVKSNHHCSIIDFVPYDPILKEKARSRYKSYTQQGFKIKTMPVMQYIQKGE